MLNVRLLCAAAIGGVLANLAFVDASQAQPAAGAVAPQAVTVGVVRSDGFLVPVATKAPGGHWTALSGIDVTGDQRTIRVHDCASLPRDGWTFHPAEGGASRPLAIRDDVTAEVQCNRQEALTTDASRPGPPGPDRPSVCRAAGADCDVGTVHSSVILETVLTPESWILQRGNSPLNGVTAGRQWPALFSCWKPNAPALCRDR